MAASWHASMAGDSPREAPPALGESRHRNDVKIPVVAPGGWGILTLGATPPAPRRSPPSCTSSALDQVSLAGYLHWASQPPQPAYARLPLKTGKPEISAGPVDRANRVQPPGEIRLVSVSTELRNLDRKTKSGKILREGRERDGSPVSGSSPIGMPRGTKMEITSCAPTLSRGTLPSVHYFTRY